MKRNNLPNRRRIGVYLLAAVLVLAAIVYMKTSVRNPLPAGTAVGVPEEAPVAVPDTSTPDGGDLPVVPETVSVALPDTSGHDSRPPYEAGYEDGYLNGMDDGAEHRERATYDESSHFPSAGERAAYIEGYREGYARGYDDGANKRQFNITLPER